MTATNKAPATIKLHVPLKLTIRGGRKTIVGDFRKPATRTRFDDSITKALARAHRWQRQMETGQYASIAELATAEGINQSYVCRILRLTLLSPSIVEAILNRRIAKLTLKDLLKGVPVCWEHQRSLTSPGLAI